MTWAAWPSDAIRVAEIFNWQLLRLFPEFDELLEWEDWTKTEDTKIIERNPPPEVSERWKKRAVYPTALEFFSSGFPLAGALSELQWQLYDAVASSRVDVKALDVPGNRTLSLTIDVLRPSNRPILGKGIWFDSRPNRIEEQVSPFVAFFDAAAASRIQNTLITRSVESFGVEGLRNSFDLRVSIQRAKFAITTLFGSTQRPPDVSQDATTALVNEFLQKQSLPTVSKDTVRRALGER